MCVHCERQVKDMANSINVSLSPSQIKTYEDLRCRIPTGNEEEGSIYPWSFCDQELFCLILPPDLRCRFMEERLHIFPEGNFANLDILQLIEQRQQVPA